MQVAIFEAVSTPHKLYYVCVDDDFMFDPSNGDYQMLLSNMQDVTDIDSDEFIFIDFAPVDYRNLESVPTGAVVTVDRPVRDERFSGLLGNWRNENE